MVAWWQRSGMPNDLEHMAGVDRLDGYNERFE